MYRFIPKLIIPSSTLVKECHPNIFSPLKYNEIYIYSITLKCQLCNNNIKFMAIHSNSYQYWNSNLVTVCQSYSHFGLLSPEVNLTLEDLLFFLESHDLRHISFWALV